MAWMKSNSTGNYFLTEEFTWRGQGFGSPISQAEAEGISRTLGFETTKVDSADIIAAITRAQQNRAELIRDIAAAVTSGGVGTAVDYERIAAEVEARLADEFAAVNANIDDQPTEFKVVPA